MPFPLEQYKDVLYNIPCCLVGGFNKLVASRFAAHALSRYPLLGWRDFTGLQTSRDSLALKTISSGVLLIG